MKCKKQWIKDPKWQETRKDLQGRWRNQERYCIDKLSTYIGPFDVAPISKLCVVINYFNSAGFKPRGKVHDLKSRVIAEYERRINE